MPLEKSARFSTHWIIFPLHKGNKEEILAAYRMLLTRTIRNGIHSRNELITYITKEDAIFRAFLSHLHDFEGESMADITRVLNSVVRRYSLPLRERRLPIGRLCFI